MLLEMKQNHLYLILTKIYEQIDFNGDLKHSSLLTKGNFQWRDGIKDTSVIFVPNE